MFSCAAMLLTLVRHERASKQNNFEVHVLHQELLLACYVRKGSFIDVVRRVHGIKRSPKRALCILVSH
jgi:hypothetical protein